MASNKNCKVTNLSITRDGNKFKASWKKPSNWSKNWDWTDVEFWIDRANATHVETDVYRAPTSSQKPVTYTKADRFWIKGSGFNDTSESKNYDRKRYHPVVLKKYCKQAWVGVHGGWNPSGKPTERGNKAWASYNFQLPRVPSVKITYNNEKGNFTVVVKTDPGKDQKERYDTRIKVSVRKSNGKDAPLMAWTSTTSTEWKKTFNVSKYLVGMEAGKYIELKVWAYARGMAGDNPTASAVKPKTYTVVWPKAPSIKAITLHGGHDARSRIRIDVNTGGKAKEIKVQRRIGPTGSWTDVPGAKGNQTIPAYFDNYIDAKTEKGVKVYYRTVATRENYTSYSNATYAKCLYIEVPKGTAVATLDTPTVSARDDSTSVTVIMPWTDADKNSGCELIYSTHSYFDSYETRRYTGSDEKTKKEGRTTKTVTIYGLSPGTKYYFKFRRYRIHYEETYYSSWSGTAKIIMPEETTDTCGIKSPSSNNLGTQASFTVVTNLKNTLHHIGIEITYSESKDAWTSSSETPSSQTYSNVSLVDVTDPDWTSSWTQQVSLTLTGLTIGATYYMKARVFGTYNDEVIYSPYSSMVPVTMQSAENDKCSISVSPLSGGTRAELIIEVDEDSQNSGTEIQWSTYENSWYSNETPNSIKADWALDSLNKQTVYLSGLLPSTMYYVRARRYNDAGGNPGPWSEIVSFNTVRDTAENDSVGIVSAIPDPSGTSAAVVIGWNEDNQNLATEISWSDNALAWTSNVSPSAMELNWAEDPVPQSEDWSHTQTIQLRDLSLGTTYYIKARRKNEDESGTTWTPYSPMATVVMPTKSENVDVRCGIVLLESEPDGVSAKIIVGWDGDHAGCEVSWSDDPNAWESSSQPNSFEFDWSDSEPYPGHYESADGMVFDETIEFYSRSGSGTESDPYVYTKIDEPSSEGMYTYYLTSDTDISIGKSYYTRSGSGTDADPYVYTLVTDPVAEDIGEYYERTCNYFVLMDAWANTSTCYIKGLDQGVLYYVKARSYGGKDKTYSAYTEDRTVLPFAYPDSVVLTVPAYVTRGKPIECWWEVSSDLLPTEWHMHLAESPNISIADGTGSLTHTILDPTQYGDGDSVNLFVEAGCGGGLTASGVVTVPVIDIPMCEAYGDNVVTKQPADSFVVYTDNPISILYATCYSRGCTLAAPDGDRDQLEGDSVWTASLTPSWTETSWSATSEYSDIFDAYEDAVQSYEDCKEAFDATPEAQALAEMTEDDPGYSEAYDAAYSTPEGIALQDSEGVLDTAYNSYVSHSLFDLTSDTAIVTDKTYYTRSGSGTATDPYVYESVANPVVSELGTYYEEESIYSASVEMPIVDLYDGGSYWCEFAVIEKTAGVSSDISTVEFSVEYAHQAPDIENYVSIVPNYEKRSVTINLGTPVGSVESDVYDIYRMTPTGFDLIREGVELGSSLEDLYAPFGHDELMYRVAIRTSDRDFAWLDFPYIMPVYVLRFDWKFGFVEYPWNLGIRENLTKNFESRMHVDGSVNGYWDKGVEHKGSFSTDVIRVDSWELIKNARDIGSYPGPIFVRDSYGKAMECNVEVSEISIPNLAQVVGISFDFTSIKLTDQFKPDNGSGGLPEDDEGD